MIDSSVIKGKKLKCHLKFLNSSSASNGSVLFLVNQIFANSETKKILSNKYTTIPLPFKIGPLILSSEVFKPNESLSMALGVIKN